MKFDFNYTIKTINYKGYKIQTYKFGSGKKTILALPSFPHSGIYYLWFMQYYDLDKATIITFDLPGWVGESDDIFKKEKFSLETCVEIAKTVVDSYSPNDYGVIGYSFGGALAARLASEDPRIKRIILASSIIDSQLLKGYWPYGIIGILYNWKLGFVLKLYLVLRFGWYKRALKKEQMSSEVMKRYEALINKADGNVLLHSLYTLFSTDWSVIIKELKNISILVISSRDESRFLRLQSEHIRRELDMEKSFYISGAHEDFILKPKRETVKCVIDFLTS